jgi:S-methylmethionine-dependent homocysteine/selenocysteine methylase
MLPQRAGDRLFITDAGIETVLIFQHGRELPCFAAFDVLRDNSGVDLLRDYFDDFLAIAKRHGAGMLLDTVTWRASSDWGERLGYSPPDLEAANRRAVALAQEIRARHEQDEIPILISGCVGPRGDGYVPHDLMSAEEAEHYHSAQTSTLADAGVDLIGALTLTYAEEAVGIVRAARGAGLPVSIAFTVETDGHLPSGQALADAIEQVDADTNSGAAYFMINCAHPTHFLGALGEDGGWKERIRGLRANASKLSHAELDEADELDSGDPAELAAGYLAVRSQLPGLTVVGGCCGTDQRHVAEVCAAFTD